MAKKVRRGKAGAALKGRGTAGRLYQGGSRMGYSGNFVTGEAAVKRAVARGLKTTRKVNAKTLKITGQRSTSALRPGGGGTGGRNGNVVFSRRGGGRLSGVQSAFLQSAGGRVGMRRRGAVALRQG